AAMSVAASITARKAGSRNTAAGWRSTLPASNGRTAARSRCWMAGGARGAAICSAGCTGMPAGSSAPPSAPEATPSIRTISTTTPPSAAGATARMTTRPRKRKGAEPLPSGADVGNRAHAGLVLGEHDDPGARLDPFVEVDGIVVVEPDAAGGDGAADRPRGIGAVDAVERVAAVPIEVERTGPERILESARHAGPPGLIELGLLAQHPWRRCPGWPFALEGDRGAAGELAAEFADADPVADGAVILEHVIEEHLP